MSKIIGYGVLFMGLTIGLLTALSTYNESAASKIYAQGQAESMIIRAASQAQQASMAMLFPYFVLGLGFLGLICALIVWITLAERRHTLEEKRLAIIENQSVVERHYIHSKETVLIAPQRNRREFYRSLRSPANQPVKILSSK